MPGVTGSIAANVKFSSVVVVVTVDVVVVDIEVVVIKVDVDIVGARVATVLPRSSCWAMIAAISALFKSRTSQFLISVKSMFAILAMIEPEMKVADTIKVIVTSCFWS